MAETITKKYLDQRFGKLDQKFAEAKQERELIKKELRHTESELGQKIDSRVEELALMTQRGFTAVQEQIKNVMVFEIGQLKKDMHDMRGRVTIMETALSINK